MERLAKSLALKMYNNQLIAYDSIDNYSYAIEMCAIRILGWVILLSIAALIGWFLEICCYLLFFSMIRQYGGGIHLNSLFGCLFVSIALTILPVVLFQFGIPFSICQGGGYIINDICHFDWFCKQRKYSLEYGGIQKS